MKDRMLDRTLSTCPWFRHLAINTLAVWQLKLTKTLRQVQCRADLGQTPDQSVNQSVSQSVKGLEVLWCSFAPCIPGNAKGKALLR